MQTVQFIGDKRAEVGKKPTKAIRNDGRIPCVIYGGEQNIHFSTTHKEVKNLIYTPDFKIAEISINGATHKCILKEVQFHPVKEDIRHIDFLILEEGKTVKLEVPIKFQGVSPGVKGGGILIQSLRRVKIKTIPEKMVDMLFGDISTLELGHAIRVKDLEVPEGIEIMNSPGIPIASVAVPRALKDVDAEEGELEEEEGTETAEETAEEKE